MIWLSKSIAIIQARTGSNRLPGKVLKDISGYSMLGLVITRLKLSSVDKIVIATTDKEEDKVICDIAKKYGVDYFRGEENDVLSRFIGTLNKYDYEIGVRVTADCPFIDYKIVDNMVDYFERKDLDYLNVIKSGLPRGLGCEVFSVEKLKEINKKSSLKKYHREHVTCFFYENSQQFKLDNFPLSDNLVRPDYRLTVDTKEDLQVIKKVAGHFYPKIDFDSLEINKYLDNNKDIIKINSEIKQKKYTTTG